MTMSICFLQLLWNYKLNLTTDPKFESVAVDVCKSTISEVCLCQSIPALIIIKAALTPSLLPPLGQIKECAAEQLGKGYLMSCLVDHRGNISDYHCKQYVTKMTSIIFSDFRLICGFMDSCRNDINSLRCGSISTGEKVSCWARRIHSSQKPANQNVALSKALIAL